MTLPKRARETLEIFRHHPNEIVSINMVGAENFALAYTFRNGVAELRDYGFEIEYMVKERGYRLLKEPSVQFKFEPNGQRVFV